MDKNIEETSSEQVFDQILNTGIIRMFRESKNAEKKLQNLSANQLIRNYSNQASL